MGRERQAEGEEEIQTKRGRERQTVRELEAGRESGGQAKIERRSGTLPPSH